jgi:hypothetical protein
MINASWYITNNTLHYDLKMPYVRDKIRRFNQDMIADRKHPNIFTINFIRSVKTPRK